MSSTHGPALAERTIGGLHALLEDRVRALPRDTAILDIGCGTGAWLARLGSLGFADLHGIDAGSRPPLDGIRFEQRNLDRDLSDLGRRFGLITIIEVIEHLENPGAVLTFISRHLRDDGWVLLTTPNIHSRRCRARFLYRGELASFDAKGDITHILPVYLPCFERIARRYGLAITETWCYPQHGSLIFGSAVRWLGRLSGMTGARDPLPGDTLCLRMERMPSAGD